MESHKESCQTSLRKGMCQYLHQTPFTVGTEMLDIHLCIIGMYKTRSKIQVSVQVTEWLAHRYLTNVAKVRFPAGDLIPAP